MGTAYELPIHPRQREAARGEQRFFYLDPPLPLEGYDSSEDADYDSVPFVIVSAAEVPYSGPETYIFTADPYGRIASFSDLPGSFRGALDHERALRGAGEGYDIETVIPERVLTAIETHAGQGALTSALRKELEQ